MFINSIQNPQTVKKTLFKQEKTTSFSNIKIKKKKEREKKGNTIQNKRQQIYQCASIMRKQIHLSSAELGSKSSLF